MRTILLNFSGSYVQEGFRPDGCLVVELSYLKESCCYCSAETAASIRDIIRPFGADGIHWIDSGDYHYMSCLWMEKVHEPFELLLLDNHTDDGTDMFGDGILSCGGWVRTARETIPNLKKVHFSRTSELPDGLAGPGLPLYVSIDKDVLSPDCARTNWDQAGMTLGELESILRKVTSCRRTIGVDVCGELSIAKGARLEDLELNRRTNEEIQNLLLILQDKI